MYGSSRNFRTHDQNEVYSKKKFYTYYLNFCILLPLLSVHTWLTRRVEHPIICTLLTASLLPLCSARRETRPTHCSLFVLSSSKRHREPCLFTHVAPVELHQVSRKVVGVLDHLGGRLCCGVQCGLPASTAGRTILFSRHSENQIRYVGSDESSCGLRDSGRFYDKPQLPTRDENWNSVLSKNMRKHV